ncbi:hypothetical protein KBI52_06450 [Microvirga sp. HBU67558]|uniref:hypothetical protein n=1 Tax=Microvirga TaxID=186650 RepID=UPI001B388F57|nr:MULTISPECIES: hypothetical protein [unclassified Microvirga]MBQ0819861.1 hypothetical protein [Microvirga sp. HBU67558]
MKRASLSAIRLAIVLTVLCAGAQAQDAIRQPGQKQIGKVKPEVEPALIVMNSAGARLEGNRLVLTGIAPSSIIFADRPVRAAGHALTAHLLEEWAAGSDSFAKDPPNATVSVFDKAGSSVKDAVVTLKNPRMDGSQLTFEVAVLEGDLRNADGPASVFIDIIGLPFTPLSFAGMARRTAYRGAFYAGAAAAATGAYGYYHPYAPLYPYAPYPYRPY